jgi:hypothetical protein
MDCSWINPEEEFQQENIVIPKAIFCKDCLNWNPQLYICRKHDNVYTGYRRFEPFDSCSKGDPKSKGD